MVDLIVTSIDVLGLPQVRYTAEDPFATHRLRAKAHHVSVKSSGTDTTQPYHMLIYNLGSCQVLCQGWQ